MFCAQCGLELPEGAVQCARCSTRVDHAAVTGALSSRPNARPSSLDFDAMTIVSDQQTTMDRRSQSGPLRPGEAFGERYHIIRLLGIGGMGAVYHAWDSELGVAVAIKVIRPEATADPDAAAEVERRFKRELVIARQVTHRNVVRIHDLGEINGIKYITMPYVEGSDLATTLRHAGQLAPSRALSIARGIVAGLAAAHEAGVVHRDLKPANIMIEPDGEAVIMDFGIARSTGGPVVPPHDPMTTTLASAMPTGRVPLEKRIIGAPADVTVAGAVIGTIDYMAPEQARSALVDQRADIYAFGLIVYDMLTGRRRAAGDSSGIEELQARMVQAPPPVRTIARDVPEPLARIVGRCLEPNPDARYQTSEELQIEFDRLDDRGQLLPTRRSLNLRVAAAGAVAALAVIGASLWYAWRSIPEKPHEPLSVLIADFQNRTGDPGFDGTLEPALGLSVEGASFITTYSRDQARTVAGQIKAGTRLDDTAALLVSRREGIKVVLAGSVESTSSGYTISVQALDTANAKALGSAKASAASKAEVLKALAPIAATIRSVLGDKTPESEKLAAAETVTASSLDALRAYERAQDLARSGKLDEALAAYKEAIALDPAMGRAYAGMGVVYNDLKNDVQSKAAYAEALKRVDGMTEREKYRTLGTYYLVVAHNYDKAIENYQTLLRRYPADSAAHGNLGMAYMETGNPEGAVAEAREVLKIYPNNVRQRRNLALYLMYSGDFTNAIAEGSRAIAETPGYAIGYLPVALSMLASGDEAGALKTYDRMEASGAAGARLARRGRIDSAMYHGRYTETARLIGGATEADRTSAVEAAQLQIADAQVSLALGQKARAAEAALKAAASSTDEDVLVPAALVLIDAGRVAEARKIGQTLDGMLQAETSAYADIINAQIAAHGDRYSDAITALRDSIKRHDTWFARFLLGRVYVETRHFPEAMAEFELALKRRGEATDPFFSDRPTLRNLPPLYYWLARAQEAVGASDARKNYDQYIKLRADADPIDPLVTDARARLLKAASP
jgi:serine/threonine protein kinase/tetratricopeptide (TPR) repeat protein